MKKCLLALVNEEPGSMLIFLPRKIDAEWAHRQLEIEGHPVERIHGDRSQSQRVQALEGLREGDHRVLIATDIAARGIDLPIVRHIINFGMPDTVEDYIHRAGRTARGSATGHRFHHRHLARQDTGQAGRGGDRRGDSALHRTRRQALQGAQSGEEEDPPPADVVSQSPVAR